MRSFWCCKFVVVSVVAVKSIFSHGFPPLAPKASTTSGSKSSKQTSSQNHERAEWKISDCGVCWSSPVAVSNSLIWLMRNKDKNAEGLSWNNEAAIDDYVKLALVRSIASPCWPCCVAH